MTVSSISSLSNHAALTSIYRAVQQREPIPQQEKLKPADRRAVEKLKQRDAEVRRHEQQHLAAAGPYGQGPPKFDYEKGPDGEKYVVGGHVTIDTEEISGNPEATIKKAQVIRRAALALKDPSVQDRKIAQKAEQMEAKAQQELKSLEKKETEEAKATKATKKTEKQVTAYHEAAADSSIQYYVAESISLTTLPGKYIDRFV